MNKSNKKFSKALRKFIKVLCAPSFPNKLITFIDMDYPKGTVYLLRK